MFNKDEDSEDMQRQFQRLQKTKYAKLRAGNNRLFSSWIHVSITFLIFISQRWHGGCSARPSQREKQQILTFEKLQLVSVSSVLDQRLKQLTDYQNSCRSIDY